MRSIERKGRKHKRPGPATRQTIRWQETGAYSIQKAHQRAELPPSCKLPIRPITELWDQTSGKGPFPPKIRRSPGDIPEEPR